MIHPKTTPSHSLDSAQPNPAPTKRAKIEKELSLIERVETNCMNIILNFLDLRSALRLSVTSSQNRGLYKQLICAELSLRSWLNSKKLNNLLSSMPKVTSLLLKDPHNLVKTMDERLPSKGVADKISSLTLELQKDEHLPYIPNKWLLQFSQLQVCKLSYARFPYTLIHQWISQNKNLQELVLNQCHIDPLSIQQATPFNSLESLKTLRVANCEGPMKTLIFKIVESAKNITRLEIHSPKCSQYSLSQQDLIKIIQSCPQLTYLSIDNITEQTLTILDQSCLELTHLTLSNARISANKAIEQIAQGSLKKLISLNIARADRPLRSSIEESKNKPRFQDPSFTFKISPPPPSPFRKRF